MKKKPFYHYTRRDFIREFGLAAGIAIPFLRSSVAMGQSSQAPTRLLIVPLVHGWGADRDLQWFTGSEFNFTIPKPLDAFRPIRNQMVFIDGLRTSFWGNAHDVSYSDILTCSTPINANVNNALGGPFFTPSGPSIDWLIGNTHNKGVLRLSAGYQSWGAQHNPLSFDNTQRNLAYYTNAREAYRAIIDPLKQMQQNQGGQSNNKNITEANSLLSLLGSDADRLLRKLAGSERAKMESYIESLNTLGNRLRLNGDTPGNINNITLPNTPGSNLQLSDTIDNYLEMIRVAFTLDTHRVAILGLGEGGMNNWTWTDSSGSQRVGNTFGNDFHHEIAHYDRAPSYTPHPDAAAAMDGWIKWYANKIVGFVNTLSQITDIDGRPLIDNTIIVLTGEVGNGNHDRNNIVYPIIGGGGAGRIRRNRLIQTPKFDPANRQGFYWGALDSQGNRVESNINYGSHVSQNHVADLWVSIARLCGVNISTFGFNLYNSSPISLT